MKPLKRCYHCASLNFTQVSEKVNAIYVQCLWNSAEIWDDSQKIPCASPKHVKKIGHNLHSFHWICLGVKSQNSCFLICMYSDSYPACCFSCCLKNTICVFLGQRRRNYILQAQIQNSKPKGFTLRIRCSICKLNQVTKLF